MSSAVEIDPKRQRAVLKRVETLEGEAIELRRQADVLLSKAAVIRDRWSLPVNSRSRSPIPQTKPTDIDT